MLILPETFPKRAATDTPPLLPPPELGLAHPNPILGVLPGHHTYLWKVGRAGRAPALTGSEGGSQTCSDRESLILHQGNKAKSSTLLFLGDKMKGWRERTGGGNSQSLEHGLERSPCTENYISEYISFPVWRIYPCHRDKTWNWD